ncbi:MAG: zeta toxin family protein [Azoarcus sp.]|jgi:predicted ABC-type ATPase|nr:zeta toxin family protein [Azoarcus sp.]
MPKKIIIIAGPHGAGKTTFAHAFLPGEAACPRFINADMIAAGLSPFAPQEAAVKAARLMLEEVHANAQRGASFAFETTLSGLSYLHLIRQWQKAGYRVCLYFLALSSADAAVARVAERARQGGHAIPEEIIRRRFASGLRNFERHYRGYVDAWITFDNLSDPPRFLELGENPTRFIIHRWSATAWQYRLVSTCTYAPPWRPKTHTDLAAASDAAMQKSFAALLRAAQAARQTAIQTDTAIIVARKNGKFVRVTARRLEKQRESITGT